MCYEVYEQLERINKLSEIALEFHGELLGEVAATEVVGSSLDLADLLEDSEEEALFDEDGVEQDDQSFADSEE